MFSHFRLSAAALVFFFTAPAFGATDTPLITSVLSTGGNVGAPFSYQITATNNPIQFGATPLPDGLAVDAGTGIISGTPTTASTFNVTIGAANSEWSGSDTLVINIAPAGAPVITSTTTITGAVGQSFIYNITASNNPVTYSAGSLPGGVTSASQTGLLSGTPTKDGTFNIKLSATNPSGTGTGILVATILPLPPVVSSTTSVSGIAGQPFNYQIAVSTTATTVGPAGLATSYGASGLPNGLTINTATGLISGVPVETVIADVTVSASNTGGTGTEVVEMSFSPASPFVPVFTSPSAATAVLGQPFAYAITATNGPTGFGATGLPTGLTFNPSTGEIVGAPAAVGTFNVTLGATNTAGTGNLLLVLSVTGLPSIISPLSENAAQNTFFTYTIAAVGDGNVVLGASNLPPGLSFSVDTISGKLTAAGVATISLTATNAAGTDTEALIVKIAKATGSIETTPVIASAAMAIPDHAHPGDTVDFTVAASDADGDVLSYAWDFGDGTSGIYASTTHAYTAVGTYTATMTATDGLASVSQSLTVTVIPPSTNVSATANVFHAKKMMLRLNLTGIGNDQLKLSGTVPVNIGTALAGLDVSIVIGKLSQDFKLDAQGKSITATTAMVLTGKTKGGTFGGTPAKFQYSVKKTPLIPALQGLGFSNDNVQKAVQVPVLISVGGNSYLDVITVTYTARTNKTGTAK